MSQTEDQKKFQKLIKQVKETKKNDDDAEKEIDDNLEKKSLRYFLKVFSVDDSKIDDNEWELLEWLEKDLFQTEDEKEYKKRIENMKKKE